MNKNTPPVLPFLTLCLFIIGLTIIGISAVEADDPNPTILLFIGVATGVTANVVTLAKGQKTAETAQKAADNTASVDQKVDQLLNGSLQGRINTLERRVGNVDYRLGNIEEVVVEIRDKLNEGGEATSP
jgi:hypothetical protein